MRLEKILSMLSSQKEGCYISEKDLAKGAGIPRNAVSRQIMGLRRYGYNIESKHGMGYRLAGQTENPLPWELATRLNTSFVGKQTIVYLLVTNSTQSVAVSIAEKNPDSHGIVVIAEQQKSGRGRQKRRWLSPKGGLWLSVILKQNIPSTKITLLPFAAALAVHDAIKKTTQLDPKLRWPNDVTIAGKKIAGIIMDISTEGEHVNYAVIGIGINVNVDSSVISSSIEKGIAITSISDELGRNTSLLGLTRELLERIEYYCLQLEQPGSCTTVIDKWKKNSDILGHKVVVVHENKEAIQGIAADINYDGTILLRTEHNDISLVADDIRVLY